MFPLILLPVQIVLIVLSALFVIISQCCGSKKNRAMEQFLKQENLDYQVQSTDFMTQANSLEDFFGKVVMDNIVYEKKKAYAKQPNDMKGIAVNWDKWPNVARKVEDANVASKIGIKPMVAKAGGVTLLGQSTLAGSAHGKTKRVSQKKPGTISKQLGSGTSVAQKSSATESAAKSTTQKSSATLGQKSEADREKSKKEEEEETETETDEEEETTDNEEEGEEGEESGDENEDDEEEEDEGE